MSLTNIKDLDVLICKYLDDKDLISFGRINKYYYNIFNNSDLWRWKILQFNIQEDFLCKTLNKEYYIELYKNLHNENFVQVIFDAINAKRCDIVSLVFIKRKLNPNFDFKFRYEVENLKRTYYALRPNFDGPYSYSPINLCIRKNYYPMWNFFNSNYDLIIDNNIYITSISSKNTEVFKDILKLGIPIDYNILLFSIKCHNLEITKIILDLNNQDQIYELMNYMIIDFSPDYYKWIQEYNESFLEILKRTDIDYFRRLAVNNKEFIKVLNYYEKYLLKI